MSTVRWSYNLATGRHEGVEGTRFAAYLVPGPYGWHSIHVTVGEPMRELFQSPIQWGTLCEMKKLVEKTLAHCDEPTL